MKEKGTTTAIRNASWVIYWDSEKETHRYGRNLDVVFQGKHIQYIGPLFKGEVDTEIQGTDLLVMPGLVNLHCHLYGGSVDKGIFDDIGAKALYGHALYSYSSLLQMEEEEARDAVEGALCELLRSGVTTVVDISRSFPGKWELLLRSGLRVYIAESFRQARWVDIEGREVRYEWNEKAGWEGLEKAVQMVQAAGSHPSGKLGGIIMPAQVDTCKADLFQEAFRQAVALNVPFHTHGAQTLVEVHEILRRHGISPIQWLEELGVLSERTTLGHCIFLDHHPWSPLRSQEDISRLAAHDVSVAHCPTVFARTGMSLHTFGKYRKVGINLGLGTDSYPYNMLEEIRNAIYLARVSAGSVFDTSTKDAFYAATVGGARALLRNDIGRLAQGCRADLVLVDLNHPSMLPVHDPLRSLVFVAAERAVRDVYIDGELVLKNGNIQTMDWERSKKGEQQAQEQVVKRVSSLHPKGRSLNTIAPLSLD